VAEGIQLLLTSTGVSASNLFLDDIRSEASGGRRGLAPEYVYVPAPTAAVPLPSIVLTYGGAVPMSFERGDIRGQIANGLLIAEFIIGGLVQEGFDPFVGDTGTGGTKGLVPAPAAGDGATKYLKADGTWEVPVIAGFAQTIVVAKTGGDYATIEAGLAAAAAVATTNNRIALIIYPGDYTENNPLTVPDFTSVEAPGGAEVTRMICANGGALQHGLILASSSDVFGLQVRDASGAGAAGFYFPPAVRDSYVHHPKTTDCDIGWLSEASTLSPGIAVRNPVVFAGTFTSIFKCGAGGLMNVNGALVLEPVIADNVFHSDGAGSTMRVTAARLNGNVATLRGVYIENLGDITTDGCAFLSGGFGGPVTGIEIASTGGTAIINNTYINAAVNDAVLANTAQAVAAFHGTSMSSAKLTIGALAAFSGFGQDLNPLTPGPTIVGELWLGANAAERVPMSSYARDTFFTGRLTGGLVSAGTGLALDVTAGTGYVNTGTGVIKVEWAGGSDIVTSTANMDYYVYVTSAGVVSIATTQPSQETNITLAAGRSDSTAVSFVVSDRVSIEQAHLKFHDWVMDNAGPLWLSGLGTTNTGLAINVDSGVISGPDGNASVIGATPVTLLRRYRDPVVTWKTSTGNADDGFYDDGTGTLATFAGLWKKDALYVSTNAFGSTFHYVYSQATYASQVLAEAAALPVPPVIFETSDFVMPLAGLVIQDASATVTTITDERPTLGVAGSGSGAVAADHGALTGLGDDDHAQYALLAGNAARNVFTGTLAAAAGEIILPTAAVPAQTAEGSVVWDSNDDLLTVGDGAARKTMVDTAGTQILTNKTFDACDVSTHLAFTPVAGPAWVEGQVYYDNVDKTLAVDVALGSTLQIGQEIHLRVLNDTGAQIDDGEVVYVSGASGVRPEVTLADASTTVGSTGVIGIATQNILHTAEGYVTTQGLVRGLDTTGPGAEVWAAGDPIYLSATVPGGMTNVEVVSPNHLVKIGWVLSTDAVNGVLLISIDPGAHFADLHDVLITTPSDKQVLAYTAATGLWENETPIVANTGVILYSGGTGTNYSTIVLALAAAAPGDVVMLGQGTFAESFTIPLNVTVRGSLGDGQSHITGAAATGTRIAMSNLSRLEQVKVTLPTDALPAISHALGAPGVTFLDNIEMIGAGALGIGVQNSGQGNCIVSRLKYRSGACAALLHTTAACTGKLDAWDTRIGGGTLTDGVLAEGGTMAVNRLSAPSNATLTDGVSVDAAVFAGFAIFFDSSTTNALHVTANNAIIGIDGFNTSLASVPLLVDPAVTTGSLQILNGVGTGSLVDAPSAYLSQGNNVIVFLDASTGDEGLNIWGELHVGSPFAPRESVFGGGDSHVIGMSVFTNTSGEGGVWADVTADAASGSGSPFAAFAGLTGGNCFYFGGDLPFPGIKTTDITTALALGIGSVILEYWTGAWTQVDHMAADSNAPYGQYADSMLERAGGTSEQVRFGDMTGWTTKALNGTTKYWARLRVVSAITTAPIFEQVKLHTDRFEANADGATEWFGAARPNFSFPFNLSNMLEVDGFGPKDQTLDYSLTVALKAKKNQLQNSAVDGAGGKVTILEGTDTSFPLTFNFDIFPLAVGGDFEIVFTRAVLTPTDPLDGTVAELATALVQTAGTINVPQTFTYTVDVSSLVPGDSVAFALTRDATVGNDPPDTLGAHVALESVQVNGIRWK
jgi:hypothetical protein